MTEESNFPPFGGEAVRDERAHSVKANGSLTEGDVRARHRDNIWMGMGIHRPAEESGASHKRHKRGRHHRQKQGRTPASLQSQDTEILGTDQKKSLAPGARVQFLLEEKGEEHGEENGVDLQHPLFTEMEELHGSGENMEWRETARWVKFEEDVEEGGNRWSKPHVATLSLHSLFELRSCLMNGTVILDMDAPDLIQIVDIMLEKMVAAHQLEFHYQDDVRDALLKRHTHQYQHSRHQVGHSDSSAHLGSGGTFMSTVRSIAEIGRNLSHGSKLMKQGEDEGMPLKKQSSPAFSNQNQLSLPKVGSVPRDIGREGSAATFDSVGKFSFFDIQLKSAAFFNRHNSQTTLSGGGELKNQYIPKLVDSSGDLLSEDSEHHHHHHHHHLHAHMPHFHVPHKMSFLPHHEQENQEEQGNAHFMKKLTPGSEASNVLVGEVDFLSHHISAFIRLKNAEILGDLTEVPVPTRFLFILLGPNGHGQQYREIGRAIATLMSDEVFHDVAYKAHSRSDLLDGVDEFLDQVTVLPPGEWDPNIRIEPPSHIPSQEKRKHTDSAAGGGGRKDGSEEGAEDDKEDKEMEGHAADPTLKRTGRLFGGLIQDIKRKAPWYSSDYKDALNVQCVATFFFMYFALLAPIVTFGGLLEEATGQRMAAMENLLSGALCGSIYSLFSGQPLTIIGSTGPVLVFEKIIYEFCQSVQFDYLAFRFWINTWTSLILMIMVATDASALVSYITRFTEESFATLIALIFIFESIKKLAKIMNYASVAAYAKGVADPNCTCGSEVTNYSVSEAKWIYKTAKQRKLGGNLTTEPWLTQYRNGSVVKSVGINYEHMELRHCQAFKGHLFGDCHHLWDVFLMSLVLMIGTFILAMTLKKMRNSRYFPAKVRGLFSDFAVMIAIVVMVVVDILVGIDTPKLNVPSGFTPTYSGRGWLINPFGGTLVDGVPRFNPWWTCIAAIVPALLACILLFMDQQITAVIVNRKENKLKKGCGYHLDLFILTFLVLLVGILGLPIYVAATVLAINHVNSLRVESEACAPGEKPTFMGVREQRVTGLITFICVGLSVLLATVLKFIPMPVLYGVFLYMGISALNGIQLFDRLLLLFMPMKYQPDYNYLRHVPIRRVHLFTAFQVACLAVLWAIKSVKKTSIAFPIMLVLIVGVRKLMEYVFTDFELQQLDDKMPEMHLRNKEDKKKAAEKHKQETDEEGGDEGEPQPGLRPVKTEAHLHIPMASGNVMKIPLTSIAEQPDQETPVNISDQIKHSGVWKHIASETELEKMQHADKNTNSVPSRSGKKKKQEEEEEEEEDEDFEPITIRIDKASPQPSPGDSVKKPGDPESQPLLSKKSKSEAKDDEDKRESSV